MDKNRCPICGGSFISARNNTKGLLVWKVTGKEICYYFESHTDALHFTNSHDFLSIVPIQIIPNMKITMIKEREEINDNK